MKRIITLLIVLAICLTASVTAAAEGTVTYSGDSGNFIFSPGSEQSPTDLFENFKNVMPGDSIEQAITVKNEASNKVKVKIYMRALGAHEDSEAFLSKLNLSVIKLEDTIMFDAKANETAGLSDWVELGTLYSGAEVDLKVILNVPLELENEYAYKIGKLDWEFKIEEFPIEPTDPNSPATGDGSQPLFWLAVAVASTLSIIVLLIYRNKKNYKQD